MNCTVLKQQVHKSKKISLNVLAYNENIFCIKKTFFLDLFVEESKELEQGEG